MRVAQRLAGYSLEEADNLRKATGKKDRKLIAKERSKFVDGCIALGHPKEFGESIFDTVEPFADYSFNKSHSVGYGFVAYQTAYLKANHPVEYFAALLTSVKTNKDQTAVFLNECRQLGIAVLVPDVNVSVSDFSVHDGRISFGLSAVRNVGEGVVAHIVAARDEGGPFADFYDFCDRVDPSVLNKRTIESLIKAGAFDSLGHPRQGLVFAHELLLDSVARPPPPRSRGPVRPVLVARRRRACRHRQPRRDPRCRVPEGAAAGVREGDARPVRERAPAAQRRAVIATPCGVHARRAPGRPGG